MVRFAPTSRRTPSVRPQERPLRLESLETRCMLSHPAVAAVNVSSTAWTDTFVSFLESSNLGVDGYAIPVGSSTQLQSLPWTNINQIRITFTEDVKVEAADLSVSGVKTTAYAFSNFSYNSNTYSATWTLASAIPRDKVLLDLDADGMDPVCSVATEEVLDGAWTNCSDTYNSGNGNGGTDFEFRINVLPGDVDASNSVFINDAAYTASRIGAVAGGANYGIRYDVDGSGAIASADYTAVHSRVGSLLPSGNPVGMTNDAPTTSGLSDISVARNASDYVLSLANYFDDAETAATNLTYSIVNNSNSSLFDSLTFDSSGNLTFDFASNTTGSAALTIRATDAAGLFVDTTVDLFVSYAPFISDFYCANEYGDIWTISGTATDYDDSVVGNVVTFGGVLASYNLTATVNEDGMFSITVELLGLQEGTATAQTVDPHGVLSALAMDWVVV